MKSLTKTTFIAASLIMAGFIGCGDRAADTMDRTTERAGDKIDQAKVEIKEGAAKAEATVGDAAITAKVKGKLVAEPGLKTTQIDVNTENGSVKLSGTVSSPEDSTKAQEIAQSVDGVKSVENHLTVKSTTG